MNKICTSLSQSKKLMELGIDVSTADMLWTYDFTVNDINGINVISEQLKPEENDIPAWSISALMELIPSTFFVDTKSTYYSFCMNKGVDFYNLYYKDDSTDCYIPESDVMKDNLLDASYKMVVWLLENKHINKD